jgi:surface antigen
MKKALLLIVAAAALVLSVPAAFAKDGKGSDDNPAGHVSGKDDPAGHDAGDDNGGGGKGADDPANHDANDDKGGAKGGNGADDPANHDANDDSKKASSSSSKARTKAGACTIRSKSKLKANAPKNGRIQVEFEVESHRTGQVWNVLLTDNGKSFLSRKSTTKAGELHARAFAKNQAGTDAIWATATNPASGETCKAAVSV